MMSSLCLSPKGGKGNRFDYKNIKNRSTNCVFLFFFLTQVSTAMFTLDKHRLESSCSGLISCLWYVCTKKDACLPILIFSLYVNHRLEGTTLPHPQKHTRLVQSACWQQQRGWAGERPGLIIDRREVVAQEAKQETNGSTDGLLQTHPCR